ncbi:NADH dehydrogenase [ubiquinone] 1 alpha subcomplex subunit 12-like [Phocoena sinus]|uniref:NADH dehydrogenase [ubiquinone] 1 alpha subcomplex subunit 12 n=1 Tax=Phocoena sinus TaxID=42100 RepID=A0A8C9AWL0_PHOSS|nr:NADH dehydrogenase [ubiquinone] 1 alpha subcomplex subunit 12-like [Phocoena sinus]
MELMQVLKLQLQHVSGHSGLCGYPQVFLRANDVRVGALAGKHKYGNKCCEDNKQFFGRHRWIIYTTEMNGKNTFWGTSLHGAPPERHRWLHSMTDDPPTTKPPTASKFMWTNHKFTVSGTPQQHVPYSTTRKKIQEWIPPSIPYR